VASGVGKTTTVRASGNACSWSAAQPVSPAIAASVTTVENRRFMSDFFHGMEDRQMDKHRAASMRCAGRPRSSRSGGARLRGLLEQRFHLLDFGLLRRLDGLCECDGLRVLSVSDFRLRHAECTTVVLDHH
jgi:hypothetical protein